MDFEKLFEEANDVDVKIKELKRCPFCGRKATIIKNECEETGFIGYFVFHSCGLMEGIRTKLEDTPERAAYDWNRRATNE